VENASTAVIGGKDGKTKLAMGVPIYHGWYDRAQAGRHAPSYGGQSGAGLWHRNEGSYCIAGIVERGMGGGSVGCGKDVGNCTAGLFCFLGLR
jgi:hypothetical protein